jgi:hypothetical protein
VQKPQFIIKPARKVGIFENTSEEFTLNRFSIKTPVKWAIVAGVFANAHQNPVGVCLLPLVL